jgi:hypothetical protein
MKTCTAFYRPLRGLSVAQQRKLCETAAARLGLKIATEYDTTDDPDARDEWIRQLVRRYDVAMVAKLEVIGETRETTKSPTADFGAAAMAAALAAEYMVEAASGITSKDGAAWQNQVKYAGSVVAAGRILTKRRASNMSAKRWKKAPAGTVERWMHKSKDAERKRWAQHWRDPDHKNDLAAFEALPEELQQEFGSSSTARRIFGKRKPGSKVAGGRPPAKRQS